MTIHDVETSGLKRNEQPRSHARFSLNRTVLRGDQSR
jgi:hypothetical protein